jgi:hypothetical protein
VSLNRLLILVFFIFQVDADLVFENLEQTDLANHENHHRIAKDTSNSQEVSLESSPPVEEHWLSSTVNRIKRSINNFLSSKSKSKHNNRTKRKSHRVPRQHSLGSQEEAEEDYDDEEAEEDNEYNEVSCFYLSIIFSAIQNA